MLRDEYLRRLVDDAFIDLFLAGNDGARIYWPWRMARENGSLGNRHRNACEVYWVDSSIKNEDYDNWDVLDDAYTYNAEGVLLADTLGEFDETIESVKEGLDLADDHVFDGDVIIPLQAPFDTAYEEFAGESDFYAIGGLKDEVTDAPRIQAAESVRALAGTEIHLHGLGWGVRDGLARALHENPDLIDSVDYSTPVQSNTDAIPGEEHMSVTAIEASARLVRDLRKVTPNVDLDPNPAALRDDGQAGLAHNY